MYGNSFQPQIEHGEINVSFSSFYSWSETEKCGGYELKWLFSLKVCRFGGY
jgi:hypothetical protein